MAAVGNPTRRNGRRRRTQRSDIVEPLLGRADRGGSVGRPRCSRMARLASPLGRTARMRIAPPRESQTRTSAATRASGRGRDHLSDRATCCHRLWVEHDLEQVETAADGPVRTPDQAQTLRPPIVARRPGEVPNARNGRVRRAVEPGPSATRTDDNWRTSRPSFGRRLGKKSWRSPRACSPPSFGVVRRRQGQSSPRPCGRAGSTRRFHRHRVIAEM